jgi:hypothetical protein
MIRIFPIVLWLAGTLSAMVFVTSDYFFGQRPAREYFRSLALSLVWPFALLSAPGRQLLLSAWRKL